MDLGLPKFPAWVSGLFVALAAIGALAVIGGLCAAAWWVVSHLYWG